MAVGSMPEGTDAVSVSQYLQDLISSNSELGSRLLSLLLVSSGNGKEIMDAINKGDLGSIKNLDLAVDLKMPHAIGTKKEPDAEEAKRQLALIGDNKIREQPGEDSTNDANVSVNASPKGEKRKKNTEASARFRVRKKQKEQERLGKLKDLNIKITELYKRIDVLLDENRHWKQKLEELNEKKSREMLDRIRKRNANSP